MRANKKNILKNIAKIILTTGFALLTVFFALPFMLGIDHIGVWVSVLMSAAMTVICAIPEKLCSLIKRIYEKRWRKILLNCLFTVAALMLCGAIAISAMMTTAMTKTYDSNTTAIVLGCQVRGTRPSLMLQSRLEAALDYLNDNPQAKCIVSGGKGTNEDISEAQCMFNYLTERGISSDRIIMEDKSTSTQENLQYSAKLMQDMGMESEAVIITDGFHQWRGQHFAKEAGIETTGAKSCQTQIIFAGGYWIREIFAIVRVIVLGY